MCRGKGNSVTGPVNFAPMIKECGFLLILTSLLVSRWTERIPPLHVVLSKRWGNRAIACLTLKPSTHEGWEADVNTRLAKIKWRQKLWSRNVPLNILPLKFKKVAWYQCAETDTLHTSVVTVSILSKSWVLAQSLTMSLCALADTAFALWIHDNYLDKDHSCCDFVYYLIAGSSTTYTIYDQSCN